MSCDSYGPYRLEGRGKKSVFYITAEVDEGCTEVLEVSAIRKNDGSTSLSGDAKLDRFNIGVCDALPCGTTLNW